MVVERQFYSPDIPEGRIMTRCLRREPKFGEAGRSAWRKVWSAADRDSQRDGRQRADRRVEYQASRVQSGFDCTPQPARRNARPGDLAKPSRQCQRRVGAKDQPFGKRRSRAANLCHAEPHRTAARSATLTLQDAGIKIGKLTFFRHSLRPASRKFRESRRLPSRCSQHDRQPESSAGQKIAAAAR